MTSTASGSGTRSEGDKPAERYKILGSMNTTGLGSRIEANNKPLA